MRRFARQRSLNLLTCKRKLYRFDVEKVIPFIPEFVATVGHETRRASTDEIVGYLKEGKLIAAEVNSRILNGKPGTSLRFALLYDFDGENIILHDPGPPVMEGRKIALADFKKTFAFPGANGETTLFWK